MSSSWESGSDVRPRSTNRFERTSDVRQRDLRDEPHRRGWRGSPAMTVAARNATSASGSESTSQPGMVDHPPPSQSIHRRHEREPSRLRPRRPIDVDTGTLTNGDGPRTIGLDGTFPRSLFVSLAGRACPLSIRLATRRLPAREPRSADTTWTPLATKCVAWSRVRTNARVPTPISAQPTSSESTHLKGDGFDGVALTTGHGIHRGCGHRRRTTGRTRSTATSRPVGRGVERRDRPLKRSPTNRAP